MFRFLLWGLWVCSFYNNFKESAKCVRDYAGRLMSPNSKSRSLDMWFAFFSWLVCPETCCCASLYLLYLMYTQLQHVTWRTLIYAWQTVHKDSAIIMPTFNLDSTSCIWLDLSELVLILITNSSDVRFLDGGQCMTLDHSPEKHLKGISHLFNWQNCSGCMLSICWANAT